MLPTRLADGWGAWPTYATADGGNGRVSGAGSGESGRIEELGASLADDPRERGARRGRAGLEVRHAEERAARLRGRGIAGHTQRARGRADRDEDVQHAPVAHALTDHVGRRLERGRVGRGRDHE